MKINIRCSKGQAIRAEVKTEEQITKPEKMKNMLEQ